MQIGGRRAELLLDRRKRDIDDKKIEWRQKNAREQHSEAEPTPPRVSDHNSIAAALLFERHFAGQLDRGWAKAPFLAMPITVAFGNARFVYA
ncbi:hypothetical protein [Methylosinus sporium]|uniref:hypothetical protein n=1 Tax=Methylosinus sporium TaxID=428 RepID=UPI001FCF11CC|nr:hypothetical protein [Methylosinus sporium]